MNNNRLDTRGTEALAQSQPDSDGVIFYGEMKMVFESGTWPVLKTVMPRKSHD